MYINWILKSRNPRNSNLVRKNGTYDYFSSRTKLEVLRYTYCDTYTTCQLTKKVTYELCRDNKLNLVTFQS